MSKKKKKDKDKKKEKQDQPSSSAHKKAAVIPGEAEDQPPLPPRRSTRSTAQSLALPASSVATANIPANVATSSAADVPTSAITVPEEGIPTSSYEPEVLSSNDYPFKIYKIQGKEEEHQRGND